MCNIDINDGENFLFCSLLNTMQNANGLGLQAVTGGNYCEVTLKFPSKTVPKWVRLLES